MPTFACWRLMLKAGRASLQGPLYRGLWGGSGGPKMRFPKMVQNAILMPQDAIGAFPRPKQAQINQNFFPTPNTSFGGTWRFFKKSGPEGFPGHFGPGLSVGHFRRSRTCPNAKDTPTNPYNVVLLGAMQPSKPTFCHSTLILAH